MLHNKPLILKYSKALMKWTNWGITLFSLAQVKWCIIIIMCQMMMVTAHRSGVITRVNIITLTLTKNAVDLMIIL